MYVYITYLAMNRFHLTGHMAKKTNREEKEISFPSPARDFWEPPVSLDEECGLSKPSVFLLRYQGEEKPYVKKGCVLVVDRSIIPSGKELVVVARSGELQLFQVNQVPEEEGIELWGRVTHVINTF